LPSLILSFGWGSVLSTMSMIPSKIKIESQSHLWTKLIITVCWLCWMKHWQG
jgi:hypothetical protein